MPSSSSSSSSSTSSSRPLRIGMIGGGNIGGGVYELVMGGRLRSTTSTSNSRDRGKTTRPVLITKICVKDLSKPRSFHLDDDVTIMTTNVDSIIHDPDIDMVVEVMGGTGLARTVVETALQNNKMVVTANKALIANHLDSIQKLLLLHNNMGFGYEAAVCGGIPIIQTLQSCYTGDVVHKIQGICNGTTNYMLEKMESGAEFEEVLKEAQELGYAEADPTADVEGLDVRAKICLLAKLAFGVTVPVQDVPCRGITLLEDVDFEYAKVLGCTIKLIGTAQRLHEAREWDGPLCVYVSPVMIPTKHVLGGISSNGNAVAVTSANMGTCSYLGPGAGRFPTANSVVADICRLADGKSAPPFPLQANLELDFDYISIFYIRIPFQDGLGIIKRVGELAEEAGVSINSILQTPIRDRMSADFCVTTEECKVSQVEELCQAINQQVDFCRAPCMFMPLMIEQIH